MTRLVLRINGHPIRETPLKAGCSVVGRSCSADVFVDDPGTSRRHCELEVTDEQLIVRDLGSMNGTFLDGQRVNVAVVSRDQILKVGDIEFAFRDLPSRVAIPAPPAAAPPPPEELPDGTPCCRNHSILPAFFACPKCGGRWCADCVRIVGRPGGRRHAFCPACNALCGFLPEIARRHRRNRQGLAGRIGGLVRRCAEWFRGG